MVLLAPPALWFLGLFLAGNAEAMLNQPSSMLVPLGNVTQLPCTLSGDSITTIASHTIVWLQRKHQGSPKRILYYKDESNQHKVSGVPDRFSAFKDAQSSTCYLTISGVQAEDDGIYYCLTSAGGEWVFGGGTHLTVTGQPTVPPTVNVFPPSPEELKSSDKATAVCLMDGFYPGTVQVTWQADGTTISSGVETTTPTKLNDKYAASSYLSMRKSDWESYEAVTCKVTHEGKTVEKVVRRLDCA